MQTPAEVYQPSRRAMPTRLPDHEYGEHLETRRVRLDGSLKLCGRFVFVGEALAGELVASSETARSSDLCSWAL